jgi:hypothetical protein
MIAVFSIALFTNEYERNFNAVNNIMTVKQSSLNILTAASLLFINLVRC